MDNPVQKIHLSNVSVHRLDTDLSAIFELKLENKNIERDNQSLQAHHLKPLFYGGETQARPPRP